jgi:hypothetical protein
LRRSLDESGMAGVTLAEAVRRDRRTMGGTAPAPDKYLDLSYYDKAIAGL